MQVQLFDDPVNRFAAKIDETIRSSTYCEWVIDEHYIVDVMFDENELDGIVSSGNSNQTDGNVTDTESKSDTDDDDDVEVIVSNFDGTNDVIKYKLEPDFATNTVRMINTFP